VESLITRGDKYVLTVKPGFLKRACIYCESAAELKSLMTLILQPQMSHLQPKYAVGDTEEDRNRRLMGKAAEILVTALAKIKKK
jgi:hypothetical protein